MIKSFPKRHDTIAKVLFIAMQFFSKDEYYELLLGLIYMDERAVSLVLSGESSILRSTRGHVRP